MCVCVCGGGAAPGALREAGLGPPATLARTAFHDCCLGPWSEGFSGPALKGTKHHLDSFNYLSGFVNSGLGTRPWGLALPLTL